MKFTRERRWVYYALGSIVSRCIVDLVQKKEKRKKEKNKMGGSGVGWGSLGKNAKMRFYQRDALKHYVFC